MARIFEFPGTYVGHRCPICLGPSPRGWWCSQACFEEDEGRYEDEEHER